MKPSTLQTKAHHCALSSLHAQPVSEFARKELVRSVLLAARGEYADAEQIRKAVASETVHDHEQRGLEMWRKLRRIETDASNAATAQCNGEAYGGQPFRLSCDPETGEEVDNDPWTLFCDDIRAQVAAVFGGTLPPGFRFNQDPRGYALKLDPEKTTVPAGMATDWGGYGLLAADID